MSSHVDEYISLHQYGLSLQRPLFQCMETLFLTSSSLLSCFLNTSFIQSNWFPSSDKYHRDLSFFKVFFSVNYCNSWLSFSIFLMNIIEWCFKLFTNIFLKKILDAERITLWALNFWPSTLVRVTSQNLLSLIYIWAWQRYFWNRSVLAFVCHNC